MSHAQTGLLLPDLEGVDTVQQQIAIAKEKAGIPPQVQPDLYRFTVTRYK
jgi:AMMECR1 domain-containing protein